MSRQEHKTIYNGSRDRRVIIIQRADGSYGFEGQYFSADPLEHCWIPYGRYSESYCDSAERAESEARGRVDWLSS